MLTACSGQQLGRKINAAFINYKLRLDDMDHVPFFNLYRWKKSGGKRYSKCVKRPL